MMKLRSRALAAIDRLPPLRRVIVASASGLASKRGGNAEMLGHVRSSDMSLERSLQAVQWTLAVIGKVEPPRNFQPGDHLTDPRARQRAAALAEASSDDRFLGSLVSVDDSRSVDDLAALIRADLESALRSGVRQGSTPGVEPRAQLDAAQAVHRALEASGIRPFLMSGSLLGVVREGDFMAHDYDVDFGVLPGTDIEAARASLARLDGAVVEQVGRRLVLRRRGVVVDVFEHEERDGMWWHSTNIHEWWNTPFELKLVTVGGHHFWVPENSEQYLDENYGDWSRPVPFYEISFDTPNREYRHSPDAIRFLHSRVKIGLRTRDRWLVESAARELRDAFGVDVTSLLASSPLLEQRR